MELRDKVIYQLHIRHFTEEGTFKAAQKRIPYLKDLGIDIIQLLPICPIGKEGRKGTLGSPYAIKDYELVNPEFGTEEDLREFILEAHKEGIRVVFDVVFNHTSIDARLRYEHSEWYYRNKEGKFANKVGDWADVIDLDHYAPGLDEYLVTVLEKYVSWGADGFRFDVCSLIPAHFFLLARKALGEEIIFIGEAVDTSFLQYVREVGFSCLSNQELFASGFNALYHYATWGELRKYLEGEGLINLERYKAAFNLEGASIEKDGLIMRAIENHDQKRLASYRDNTLFAKNLLAFSFFTRGPSFIYNGEEAYKKEYPDFFEKLYTDASIRDDDYFAYVKGLIEKKHSPDNRALLSSWALLNEGECLLIENSYEGGKKILGIFNLSGQELILKDLPEGYESHNGESITLPIYLEKK